MSNTQLEELVAKALDVLTTAMVTEGEHHKVWYIDQAVRFLTGDEYSNFVKQFEKEKGVEWDRGIEA